MEYKGNKDRFVYLLTEVGSRIDGRSLGAIRAEKNRGERMGRFIDLIRSAVLSSPVYSYNGRMHYFTGRIYEPMSWTEFGDFLYEVFVMLEIPKGDFTYIDLCMKVCSRAISTRQLEVDQSKMVFRNCVLDMETRQQYDFSPEIRQIQDVDYDYVPYEDCPLWRNFVSQVIPTEDFRRVLQEFLGAIFIDRKKVRVERMLILRGDGSNGKSVIFNTVTGILGPANVSNFSPRSLMTGSDVKKNIASMNGKRLNYCSEIQTASFTTNGDTLKALISGEPMDARHLYADNFIAKDIPLMMVNANSIPDLATVDYSLRRRLLVVPFEYTVPIHQQNPRLSAELREEYSGIFNWIIEGRDRFIANGYQFSETETVISEVEKSVPKSRVLEFMEDMGYFSAPPTKVDFEIVWRAVSTLYRQFRGWCIKNKAPLCAIRTFSQELQGYGYSKRRGATGVQFAVYGENARMEDMAEHTEDTVRKKRGKPKGIRNAKRLTTPIYLDGHKYIVTYEGAAAHFGIPVSDMKKLMDAHRLEGAYVMKGRAHYFDVKLMMERLVSLGYFKDKREKEIDRANAERDARARRNFNVRMKRLGLPYRKYNSSAMVQHADKTDVVRVPLDWVYTPENVRRLNGKDYTSELE